MISKLFSYSIKTKITITIFLTLFFFSIGIMFVLKQSFTKNIDIIALRTTTNLITVNEPLIIKALLEEDYWGIYKILHAIDQLEVIESIGLIGTDNAIIAHSNTKQFKFHQPFNVDSFQGILLPLKSNDIPLGSFIITLNTEALIPLFQTIKDNLILSIVFAGILSFIIAYLISERILNRLHLLTYQAEKIQRREWKTIRPIVSREQDEITLFLNSMGIILQQLNEAIDEEENLKIFYHEILKGLDTLIVITDTAFNITYENQHHLAHAVLEQNTYRQSIFDGIKENIEEEVNIFTLEIKNKENIPLVLHVTYQPLHQGYVFSFVDITQLTLLQEKQRFTNSFEIIGEISTSVVHEIKNYLQPVKLLLEQEHLIPEDRHRILNIITKIDTLVNDFLNTGRPVDKKLSTSLPLHQFLESISFLLADKLASKELHLDQKIDPHLHIFMAPSDAELVFMNLLNNAIDASPNQGTIKIATLQSKKYCVVTITNNGENIDQEVLNNIAKPFFTTKEKGSGIGLYTVYKTVYLYHGSVKVHSNHGITTFKLNLPKGDG